MNTCGTCKHRNKDGHCQSLHIHERDYDDHPDKKTCLIYSYYESGDFWVGENFGCVHWAGKDNEATVPE